MPESTLSLALSDLAQAVAFYLGYGRTAALWTGWQAGLPYAPSTPDSQLQDLLSVVNAGLRQFYFHKPLPPTDDADGVTLPRLLPAHRWSFLCPERTLVTVTGTTDYALPDDYASFLGEMTYASPTSGGFFAARKTTSTEVRRWLAAVNGAKSPPTYFAEIPRPSDGSIGQRYNVAFYPTPDQAYTLTYRSVIDPQALTNSNPYPLGGAVHAETILESCLAVAESRMNDSSDLHAQRFMELLQASIAQDTRDHWAELAGYDGDRSDRQRTITANRNNSVAAKKRDPRLAGL